MSYKFIDFRVRPLIVSYEIKTVFLAVKELNLERSDGLYSCIKWDSLWFFCIYSVASTVIEDGMLYNLI